MSIASCFECVVQEALAGVECSTCLAAGFVPGNLPDVFVCLDCFYRAFREFQACAECVGVAWREIRNLLEKQPQENQNMPCVSTHSSKVQGAGLCCQAVTSGALQPPPPGTTLPVYQPGGSFLLPPGRITQVVDASGHCSSCMIVGSSSKKHPGRPVLKFIRGGPGCPSGTGACCALVGGQQIQI